MPITLWVNKLNLTLLGNVFNIETFNKNIALMKCQKEVIDTLKGLKEGEGTLVFKIVGRYFCFIEVNYKEALRKMVFIDFQKRDEIAMAAFASSHKPTDINAEQVRERFFQAYRYYKEIYDEGYNSVELKLDKIIFN